MPPNRSRVVGNCPDERGTHWKQSESGRVCSQRIDGGRDLVKYLNETYSSSFVFADREGAAENLRIPGPDIGYNIGERAVGELGMSDGGSPIRDGWRRPRTS